ncbi:hypothetical protein EJ08DRAFT_701792 [Tothia fuscella]|uniref:Kelch repeat protein n=1 Tax=Tothia fuscella TaxID=1048955 RepID=A0A9P4TU87_9PEZI|nr:hypothetical protein EJ08DRAFT_701792 [Tothia fuscella]
MAIVPIGWGISLTIDTPRGRARHAAVIHDDKLYILGGMGHDNYVLDDICYLDLKTWTWSRTWRFVHGIDHTAWILGGRIWVRKLKTVHKHALRDGIVNEYGRDCSKNDAAIGGEDGSDSEEDGDEMVEKLAKKHSLAAIL